MNKRQTQRNAEIIRRSDEGDAPRDIAAAMALTRNTVIGVLWRRNYIPKGRGARIPTGRKLTIVQAREIRERRLAGEKGEALAAEFGVDNSLITLIAQGKRWAHA